MSEQTNREKEIVDEALEIESPAGRLDFLKRACGQTSLSGTMLPNPHRSLFWFLLGSWACSCFAASFPFFEPIRPPRPCQVMVHRGEAGQAPENTRPALQRCIEDGLEWAEVDLRLTQDGQHILWH